MRPTVVSGCADAAASALRQGEVPFATPPLAMAGKAAESDPFTPFNSPEGAGFGGPAMPSFAAAFESPSRSSFGSIV